MTPFTESLVILGFILLVARFLKRGVGLFQRFFIPSSLIAGVLGLLLGPQLLGVIPAEVTDHWAGLPKHLISVVFAGLFLGKVIPNRREIWRTAGPMIAFGNILAWGQYVLGLALTMFFLTPLFGTNPLAGALIEISFEGGHGTAAGLAPTFQQLGWAEGTDIALALATFSIIMAITLGILFVNLHYRRKSKNGEVDWRAQRRAMIRSGYNLISLGRKIQTNPKAIIINLAAFALAIAIGYYLLKGLIWTEEMTYGRWTALRFFPYLPLFPLAMIGGLMVQMWLRKLGKQTLIKRRTAEIFSTLALDVLVASAVATVSLQAIGDNLPVFITFGVVGVVWIVLGFYVLSPILFRTYWFEKGITNMGQSMGMTATGLLLNRLVDPGNKSKARESFAYKQLAFEPFMGGGLVTAMALILIHEFGSTAMLIGSSVIFVFWLVVGLAMSGRRRR